MQYQPLKRIAKGCPICRSDIIGSKEAKYLCRSCWVFFNEEHLAGGLLAQQPHISPA